MRRNAAAPRSDAIFTHWQRSDGRCTDRGCMASPIHTKEGIQDLQSLPCQVYKIKSFFSPSLPLFAFPLSLPHQPRRYPTLALAFHPSLCNTSLCAPSPRPSLRPASQPRQGLLIPASLALSHRQVNVRNIHKTHLRILTSQLCSTCNGPFALYILY